MGLVRANPRSAAARRPESKTGAWRCRKKFLRFFPDGFRDSKYDAWERGYKAEAHAAWEEVLNQRVYRELLRAGKFSEIAARAVRIESRTNLLFSFEKMALRDAVKSAAGARLSSPRISTSPNLARVRRTPPTTRWSSAAPSPACATWPIDRNRWRSTRTPPT